ncbi:MAG: prohibitin family protein [Candidatus Thermoplasmatota archaeon]|nr:prohibitin family protein [Candidatus Thermoplasmatota archaeon]
MTNKKSNEDEKKRGIKMKPKLNLDENKNKIFAVLIVALLFTAVLISICLVSVPAGYKGVVVRGIGIGHVFDEGFNFKNPLSTVELVRYNTQRVEFIGAYAADDNEGNIVVNSKDNVAIYMDFQVVFHLDPNQVSNIRIENGNFVETIVIPYCRSVPRNVCANFDALEIRGDSRSLVAAAIQQNLTALFSEKHIILEEFALQELSLPPAYEDAITAKKVAEQNVITEQYNLGAQLYIAERTIVDAQAAANVTIIDAEAKATAVGIIMEQFGITNETEASMVYLNWLYIRALTDPNSNIQYVMGDNPFILDLNTNITG